MLKVTCGSEVEKDDGVLSVEDRMELECNWATIYMWCYMGDCLSIYLLPWGEVLEGTNKTGCQCLRFKV